MQTFFSCQQLLSAQNKCLNIYMKYPHLTDVEKVHTDAKCNFLSDRRYAHLMKFMYTRSRCQDYVDIRVRQTKMFQAPMCKVINGTAYGRSVEYTGAVGWNGLTAIRRQKCWFFRNL